METPFIFGKIATEKNFTDREMETANLVQNFTSLINTIIISPRRWGKSSLEKTGIFGGIWLRAASIRAIKTVAQTAIATIGTSAVLSDVNWKIVISSAVLSGILSMLTSIAGLPEVDQAEEEITLEEDENG